MKKCFLLLAVIVFTGTMSLQANNTDEDKKNADSITWNETSWNFGTIEQSQAVEYEFVFRNTGSEPVLISKVKSSCGCTVSSYDKDPVLPGDDGKVKVKYNARKAGAFKKSVFVILNNAEKQTLRVEGVVGTKK